MIMIRRAVGCKIEHTGPRKSRVRLSANGRISQRTVCLAKWFRFAEDQEPVVIRSLDAIQWHGQEAFTQLIPWTPDATKFKEHQIG
jgi:hypothetical protein